MISNKESFDDTGNMIYTQQVNEFEFGVPFTGGVSGYSDIAPEKAKGPMSKHAFQESQKTVFLPCFQPLGAKITTAMIKYCYSFTYFLWRWLLRVHTCKIFNRHPAIE